MIITFTPTYKIEVETPATHGVAANQEIRLQLVPFFAGNSIGGSNPAVEQAFTNQSVWQFDHNTNGYPAVVCVDAAGRSLEGGNADYPNRNTVIVRFNSAQSGTMRTI